MGDLKNDEIITKSTSWISYVDDGIGIFQINPWLIVAMAAIIYYFWTQKLSFIFNKWKESYKLKKSAAQAKKDPDLEFQKEEARMNAMNKLQSEYNKLAVEANEIKKNKENKKKQESYDKLKLQGGRKLVDNFFPLSGQNSRNYIAPRRTGCPGGC